MVSGTVTISPEALDRIIQAGIRIMPHQSPLIANCPAVTE